MMAEAKPINDFRRVKDASDIAAYITACTGTSPKPCGSVIRFNPCPFCGHKDCFGVIAGKEGYKCHSCGASGDVFTFAEHYHSLDKAGALKAVAGHFGVELSAPGKASREPPKDNRLQQVLEAAVKYYRGALAQKPDAMAYLTTPKAQGGRGHTAATIEQMEIGFADGGMAKALAQSGIDLDDIRRSGLYVEDKKRAGEWKDYFCAGVFVFPHRTEMGEIGHFTIKDPKKRIDYQMRTEHRLGGLHWGNQKAIRNPTVHIVEGENDLASFFDAGVKNVMAALGQVSDEQIRYLGTHAAKRRYVLWFDYDTKYGDNGQPPAGIKYTRKVYRQLIKDPDASVLVASAHMDPGMDPDDFVHHAPDTAGRRVQAAARRAHHPLVWELKILPPDVRDSPAAVLQWLQDIDYFEQLSLVPELQREVVMLELQRLGFSRDAVLSNLTESYGLRDILEEIELANEPGERPSRAYQRLVAQRIWTWFNDHGKFFITSDEQLHLFYRHKIYRLGDNTPWNALLHKEARLNSTEQMAKYVVAELKANCFNRADRLESFSWCHMVDDGDGPVLYLNLNDPANRICRIGARQVDLVENGTNADDVLLARSSHMKPFSWDPDCHISAGMKDLKELVFDALACEPAQRYLVIAWALASFLMPLSESRALLKMEGGSGSGKTTAAKFLSLLLYGDNMVGRSSTAGDYSMGATEPLIIKDNLETEDLHRGALNFLLLAATGATNIKRSQGTDTGVVTERLNCLVAITAIEPFAKPELINRTYIVEFSKRWQRTSFLESEAVLKLSGRRHLIISAWLEILAERVLPNLDDRLRIVETIREQYGQFSKERTVEFMALLVLISRSLLHYIPLPDSLADDVGDRAPEYALLDAWIQYQNDHARQTEQGTNVVLQLLEGLRRVFLIEYSRHADADEDELWIGLMGVKVERSDILDNGIPTGRRSYAFEASSADLLTMFQRYGREYGIKVPFRNARQLGVRLSNELSTIEASGWSVAKVKVVHGNRIARFTWSDA